jgi:hypothetical protein
MLFNSKYLYNNIPLIQFNDPIIKRIIKYDGKLVPCLKGLDNKIKKSICLTFYCLMFFSSFFRIFARYIKTNKIAN